MYDRIVQSIINDHCPLYEHEFGNNLFLDKKEEENMNLFNIIK